MPNKKGNVYFVYIFFVPICIGWENDTEKVFEQDIFYVGRGHGTRLDNLTRNPDVEKYKEGHPNWKCHRIISEVSEEQSKLEESKLIKIYGMRKDGGTLCNRREELVDNKYFLLMEKLNTPKSIDDFYRMSLSNLRGENLLTPEHIMSEWMDVMGKDYLESYFLDILIPNTRYGEIIKYLCDDITPDNIEILEPDAQKIAAGQSLGYFGNTNMSKLIIRNVEFLEQFDTDKKYDIIFLNPPFKKIGEKFILKCKDLLKDGGYLCCIISPFWRSVSSNTGYQHNKTYTILQKNGYFHYIHMYSTNDTSKLFDQAIGQVDVFVWQKKIKPKNTKIINTSGEEFYFNLKDCPQTVPVMPYDIYTELFDQLNGIGFDRYGHLRNKQWGNIHNEFVDVLTDKTFKCNDRNITKTKGKKVIIDMDFNNMFIDNEGDVVVNDRYMLFFDTNNQRDSIINAIKYIIDNNLQDLFKNRSSMANTYIPKIRTHE